MTRSKGKFPDTPINKSRMLHANDPRVWNKMKKFSHLTGKEGRSAVAQRALGGTVRLRTAATTGKTMRRGCLVILGYLFKERQALKLAWSETS